MSAASLAGPTAQQPARPPSRLLGLIEGPRALGELAAFYALRPAMSLLSRGDGHGVLVFPGFLASDSSTVPMRSLLTDLGYDVAGWELGRNVKISNERIEAMAECLVRLYRRTGGKISLVGWSLGGALARELAKLHPDKVRQVISLGSPIQPDPGHSNARHLFEALNGRRIEPQRFGRFVDIGSPPPVPSTSIYTRSDAVVAWRGSIQREGPQAENVQVCASHCGLGVNPLVMIVVADRLAQPEDEWARFEPGGLVARLFPKPKARTAS